MANCLRDTRRAFVALMLAGAGIALAAQAPAQRLSFDVASIKENKTGDGSGMISGPNAARYTVVDIAPYSIVTSAFRRMPYELAGMPDWARTTRYDITATYPPGLEPTLDQLQEMVQSLLAERFKFAAHHEMRDLPVYALTTARADGRLGPQLTRSDVDCTAWFAAGRGQIGTGPPNAIAPGGRLPECLIFSPARGVIVGGTRPIAQLAISLQTPAGRPIVDRTGLTGNFNVALQWTPAPTAASANDPGANGDVGASLFTAIQDQLGLKLEPTTAPFDVLVVDHIERPVAD